jgi:DNA-binding PadR family transcriptional regulator
MQQSATGGCSMALAHAILATLLDGPSSGYQLAKRFDRSVGYYWQATHQHIYRELVVLERRGYIERVGAVNNSPEKPYQLTPSGQTYLASWIAEPTAPGMLREDVLVKIRAGSVVSVDVLIKELQQQRMLHAEKLALYRAIRQRDFPDPEHLRETQRLQFLPLLRGIMFETDNIAWCDAALALLQS